MLFFLKRKKNDNLDYDYLKVLVINIINVVNLKYDMSLIII